MICRDCGFDDQEPVAYILGFKKVLPHDRYELISDLNLRARSTVTRNWVLQCYHVAHISGAIKCRIEPDGWLHSKSVLIDQGIVNLN